MPWGIGGPYNEVNHRVSQHEQVHDQMRSTMDTAFDYMSRITHGLHQCNVRDRQLCEAYQTHMRSWNGHMHGFRELVVIMLTSHDDDLRRLTQDLTTHGKCIETLPRKFIGSTLISRHSAGNP